MILSKLKNNRLYLMLIAYSFFALISHLSPTFSFILSGIIVASVFVLDDSDVLCFLAFASCFMNCLNNMSTFLKALYLAMTILIIKYFILAIKHRDKKKIIFISAIIGLSAILFIYSLCISNFHIHRKFQGLGVLVTIATLYLIQNIDIKKLTLILSVGLIVSSICSLISYNCGIMQTQPFIPDSLCGFRFSAYFHNVNALGLYCSLCQACILTLFLTNSLNFKKWSLLLLVITLIGLSTFSKSFMLITIITYGLAITLAFIKSKNKKKFLKFAGIGIIAIVLLALVFNNYITSILKRFYIGDNYGGGLNTVTTGRLEIWKSYLKHIFSSTKYILLGCGVTAGFVGLFTPHNFYIALLYKFGFIGILAIIIILIFIFKQNKPTKNIHYYLPLIILLINIFFEDISSSLFTCLPLLISLCFILKNKQNYNK